MAIENVTGDATRPSLGYTRYVLSLILLVAIFNTCDRTIISMLADDIKLELALSDRQMGFLLGLAFSLTYFLAGIPLSYLADRWSRPKVVSIALVIWSGMTILTGAASSFVTMALARLGVGLGEAGGSPPSHALIAEYVAEDRRARAMSVLAIGSLLGLGAGILFGGWASEVMGWRKALVTVGIPGVFVGLLFFTTVKDIRQTAPRVAENHSLVRNILGLFRIRSFAYLVAAACAINVMVMAVAMWTPSFLRRIYEMEPATAGIWHFSILIIPSAVGMFGGAWITDRLAKRDIRWMGWVPALTSLLCVPTAIVFFQHDTQATFLGLMPTAFLFGIAMAIFVGAWTPITMSVAQTLVDPDERSLAAAIWSMLSALIGGGLGPFLVGDLGTRLEAGYGEASIRHALTLMGLFPIVAAYCYYQVARHVRGDLP